MIPIGLILILAGIVLIGLSVIGVMVHVHGQVPLIDETPSGLAEVEEAPDGSREQVTARVP